MGGSHKTIGQPKLNGAHDTLASQTGRRSDTSGASAHSQKLDSPRKMLDAKFAARKTAGKPKPSQPTSNMAAATAAEIVVAASPEPAAGNEENQQHDELNGPPRKKARTSPTGTETSVRSSSDAGAGDKHQSPMTAPKPALNHEGSRVDSRRRVNGDKNFNLRAQTENPSPPANGSVGRENAHTRPKDFSQPVAVTNANVRPKGPGIKQIFDLQASGEAECSGATLRPNQRLQPAPVPTLGNPSPPSVLASNNNSQNPPPASNRVRGNSDQAASSSRAGATESPSIIAPQPQARNPNHLLNRDVSTSFGQGTQKVAGAQSQSPLYGSHLRRQDIHSQPPRPPRNSPLPSEITEFTGFGLHPSRNERSAGLGRSQSPNPGTLRRQQDSKAPTQLGGSSAQANDAQARNNTQSNGVSHTHTAARVPESTPSSNSQTTAYSRSFDLKNPGHNFLYFGSSSRAFHHSSAPQHGQSAQTAAQKALNYSHTFTSNGNGLKKSTSPSRQVPPAAVVPVSTSLRAPVAPMFEGQNGHKTPIEPLVVSLDSSSDEDSVERRTGSACPPLAQPHSAHQAQSEKQTRQASQEKLRIPNGSAVASKEPPKAATNGATASVGSGDRLSNKEYPSSDLWEPVTPLEAKVIEARDAMRNAGRLSTNGQNPAPGQAVGDAIRNAGRPWTNRQNPGPAPRAASNGTDSRSKGLGRSSMDRQKPAAGPEMAMNGFRGNVLGSDRSLKNQSETAAVPDLDENVSGGKTSGSDRPLMDRRRPAAAPKRTTAPIEDNGLDSNRLVADPVQDSKAAATPAPTPSPAPVQTKAQTINDPAATNASSDNISNSDRPLLTLDWGWKNITSERWQQLTPVERRKMLVDMHDADEFDSVIYSKANESSQPKSVFYDIPPYALRATPSSRPMPKVSAHVNPWTHWTHARTPEWHAQKQAEINARGNRKHPQNFGQAAKRLARGKTKQGHLPSYRKQELPDRVKTNPSWMAALSELGKLKEAYYADQRAKAQQRKKRAKGKGKARLFDVDGDVEMISPGSGGDGTVQQRPTEFVLHRGDWTEVKS